MGRKKVKGEYIRRLAQEDNVQELINFLVNENGNSDRKILIPTHIQRKEFSEARNLLNSLDQSTFENQMYYELFDVLTIIGEDEREITDITLSEKQIIEGIAGTNTQVSIQAQAILAELDNTALLRFPEQVVPGTSAMMINSGNDPISINDQYVNVSLFPNPSNGDVVVEFKNSVYATAELYDATGRIIRTMKIEETQRKYEMNSLPTGVYNLVIHYIDGKIETNRLIVE